MATSWKSQQGNGKYALQFETDDKEKYKFVEKASQMAVDGKTTADVVEVRHGKWIKPTRYSQEYCNQCGMTPKMIFGILPDYCPHCGAKMKGDENNG